MPRWRYAYRRYRMAWMFVGIVSSMFHRGVGARRGAPQIQGMVSSHNSDRTKMCDGYERRGERSLGQCPATSARPPARVTPTPAVGRMNQVCAERWMAWVAPSTGQNRDSLRRLARSSTCHRGSANEVSLSKHNGGDYSSHSLVSTSTNLANLRQAITILEPVLGRQPNHPGAAHYLIHAAIGRSWRHSGWEPRGCTRHCPRLLSRASYAVAHLRATRNVGGDHSLESAGGHVWRPRRDGTSRRLY